MPPKRKLELSTKPSSKRHREWRSNLDPARTEVLKAKQRLRTATCRAVADLRKEQQWINASKDRRVELETERRELVDHQYRTDPKKIHPDQVSETYGLLKRPSKLPGIIWDTNPTYDPNDDNWEDITDEQTESAIDRLEAKDNEGKIPEFVEAGQTDTPYPQTEQQASQIAQKLLLVAFQQFQRTNLIHLRQLSHKMYYLKNQVDLVARCIVQHCCRLVENENIHPSQSRWSYILCTDIERAVAVITNMCNQTEFLLEYVFTPHDIRILAELRAARCNKPRKNDNGIGETCLWLPKRVKLGQLVHHKKRSIMRAKRFTAHSAPCPRQQLRYIRRHIARLSPYDHLRRIFNQVEPSWDRIAWTPMDQAFARACLKLRFGFYWKDEENSAAIEFDSVFSS